MVGIKDRDTNTVHTVVVDSTDKATLQQIVKDNTVEGAKVYTDEAAAYKGLENHESVSHGVGEYVKGQAHTNGIESHWSMLKRGHDGTYHHLSLKHLGRYISEFSGRHNDRPLDTIEQMGNMVRGLNGRSLGTQTLSTNSLLSRLRLRLRLERQQDNLLDRLGFVAFEYTEASGFSEEVANLCDGPALPME